MVSMEQNEANAQASDEKSYVGITLAMSDFQLL